MDQKNLILAIALSLAILLGWQTLVEKPKQEQAEAERQRVELAAGRCRRGLRAPSAK